MGFWGLRGLPLSIFSVWNKRKNKIAIVGHFGETKMSDNGVSCPALLRWPVPFADKIKFLSIVDTSKFVFTVHRFLLIYQIYFLVLMRIPVNLQLAYPCNFRLSHKSRLLAARSCLLDNMPDILRSISP